MAGNRVFGKLRGNRLSRPAPESQVVLENVGVLDNQNLRTHYRIIPQPTAAGLVPLASAIAQEITGIGDLLLIIHCSAIGGVLNRDSLDIHVHLVPSDPACQANHPSSCLLSSARGRAAVARLGAIAWARGFEDARRTPITLARHGYLGEFDNRRF